MTPEIREVTPGGFETEAHYYPRVPNAQLHPLVKSFLHLGNERIATRYCHLHPEANAEAVHRVLATVPKHFRWAGADLFHVTNDKGVRRNVVVETNSCPSGQKSMPLRTEQEEDGGYRVLLERSFLPALRAARNVPKGCLAVLADKNPMETTGYAHALADLTGETVLHVTLPKDGWESIARWTDRVLEVKVGDEWRPVRAAFRYVTQKPWTRIPPLTRTFIYNPVIVCLAGGRNKLLAAKAYDLMNAEVKQDGLSIQTPETIWDVALQEVPMWVERMGGVAVVKNPYSNAGQGVYTITRKAELDAFMAVDHDYERFIVQGLVGNLQWTSRTRGSRLYHVGTVPDRNQRIFVADFRFMVGTNEEGFFPVSLYARRARLPLADTLSGDDDSWGMLGTNLSIKNVDGFSTEPTRLMLFDQRDFNRLGLGIDDLTEAYIQTCLSVLAVDAMAQRLRSSKGGFKARLFRTLNPDPALADEVMS